MELSKPKTSNVPRRRTIAMASVFFGLVIVLGTRALASLVHLAVVLPLPGENTTGEAGKVFYAERFLSGQLPFLPGENPPYYPAIHGVLLHASVGAIAKFLSLPPTDLYFTGRAISLLFTLAGLFLAWRLLRSQRVPLSLRLTFLLAFFAPLELVQHTTSYRPDNWLLGLGVLALYVLSVHMKKAWAVPALVLIALASFYIKATGLALTLAISLALIRQRQWKAGTAFVISTAALFLGSVLALQYWSNGLFLANLRNSGDSPVSPSFTVAVLSWPGVWVPPAFLIMSAVSPLLKEKGEFLRIAQTFGIVSLLAAVVTSMRSGSSTYYFLESYFYGLLLLTCLCSGAWRERALSKAHKYRLWLYVLIGSLFVLLNIPSAIVDVASGHPDVATTVASRFAEDRAIWTEQIEQQGLRYWSDDPSLNAHFPNPPVLYPWLQVLMVRAGVLGLDSFTGPLERREYDVVLFTGIVWAYQGARSVPEEWEATLHRYYERVDTNGAYQVWVPRVNDSEPGPTP